MSLPSVTPTAVMELFSKQSPAEAATKTSASKLSNGAAVVINDLCKEPTKGLMHVLGHVQQSVPILLETTKGLEAAGLQLQAVLEHLQDAQEGIMSVTSPATQQDLASLTNSIETLDSLTRQQKQQLQQLQQAQQLLQEDAAEKNGTPVGATSTFARLWKGS